MTRHNFGFFMYSVWVKLQPLAFMQVFNCGNDYQEQLESTENKLKSFCLDGVILFQKYEHLPVISSEH